MLKIHLNKENTQAVKHANFEILLTTGFRKLKAVLKPNYDFLKSTFQFTLNNFHSSSLKCAFPPKKKNPVRVRAG